SSRGVSGSWTLVVVGAVSRRFLFPACGLRARRTASIPTEALTDLTRARTNRRTHSVASAGAGAGTCRYDHDHVAGHGGLAAFLWLDRCALSVAVRDHA